MTPKSLPTHWVVALVLVTALLATGLGYLWANSKKEVPIGSSQLTAPAKPYVYIPTLSEKNAIDLSPSMFAEMERSCQTRTQPHPTCELLKSDAVQKARSSRAANAKPGN